MSPMQHIVSADLTKVMRWAGRGRSLLRAVASLDTGSGLTFVAFTRTG